MHWNNNITDKRLTIWSIAILREKPWTKHAEQQDETDIYNKLNYFRVHQLKHYIVP